jgi:hypothetical protein
MYMDDLYCRKAFACWCRSYLFLVVTSFYDQGLHDVAGKKIQLTLMVQI